MKNELVNKEMDKSTVKMLGFLFLTLLTTPLAKYIGWYFLIPFGIFITGLHSLFLYIQI